MISYAARTHAHAMHAPQRTRPAGPTNWLANGTVDVGRDTAANIRATSRDRLSSATS